MTTEVLFNEDDYVWGEWFEDGQATVLQLCKYVQVTYLEDKKYYRVGHKKKLQKLEVGKVYTTKNTDIFVCVAKVNNYGYMVNVYDNEILSGSTAYTWTEDGKGKALGSEFDVDWSVEPYEMSIKE